MLQPSAYMRLVGLAAGASLVAATVAYVRTDGGAPAKAPRQATGRPAAPAPEPAPPALAQGPAGDAAAERTGTIAPDASAPRPAPPDTERRAAPASESPPLQAAAELPPSARAALVGRAPAVDPQAAKPGRLDLNSASVAELNALRGAGRIGRRIVKHRPYRSTEDLVRKRVITRTAFARIKDQVRVGRD